MNLKKREIVILGARSVGKSSLVNQFIENYFNDAYYPTIEANFMKDIAYNGLEYDCHIIDTPGQDEYTPLAGRYAIGIHVYIIVYSITSRESFRMAQIIYRKILDFGGLTQVPCVLVGSKLDLQERREVYRWEVEVFASRHTCAWVEISAKMDAHLIGQVFQLCLQQVEDSNTRSLRTVQEITTSGLRGPMPNNALHNGRYPPLDAVTRAHTATHQMSRTESIKNTETRGEKLPTSFNHDSALPSDSSEGIFEMDLPESRESTEDVFDWKKLPISSFEASNNENFFEMDLSVSGGSVQSTRDDLGTLPKVNSLILPRHTQSTSMRSAGSVNNYTTSPWAAVESFIQNQTQAISIPSHLDNYKSRKEWPQSAGKDDITFDALILTALASPAAGDVLDVEAVRCVFSAIRKVMEDLKADASQILPLDEAAARLHTIFDLVFSNKRSCKTLLNFQGDDAKIVLNSLQWLLDYPQSNSTRRSRLLSALLRLTRKSGLYPECIILKDIVCEDDCAVTSGHFGEIWKGKFRDQQVCLKVVRIYKQSHVDHLLKVFAKEAILWSQLSHPNLLPFYGIYHLNDRHGRVCLVSPWMNNGNIKDYLPKNPWVDRVLLVSDVAAGVSYLHQKAVVHGDLKGVNILITESGRACLADFGLSNHVDAEMLTWTSESSASTGGTVRWQAPELIESEYENFKPTKESDVYAFSCVCYEIFTCQVPFHEIFRESTVMRKVLGGERPSRPAENRAPFVEWGLTDSMWRLMERCWDQAPENRPTMNSISGEDFLSSLVDDRPSGGEEALSPPQFRGAMHGFL